MPVGISWDNRKNAKNAQWDGKAAKSRSKQAGKGTRKGLPRLFPNHTAVALSRAA